MPSSAKLPESTGSPSLVFNVNCVKRGHFTSGTKRRVVSFMVPGTHQAPDVGLQSTSAQSLFLPLAGWFSHTETNTQCPVSPTRYLPRCQLMSFWEKGWRKAPFSSLLLTCQKKSGLQVPGRGLERPGSICHSERLRSGLLRAKSQAWQLYCRVLFSLAVMSASPGLKSHLPPSMFHTDAGDPVTRTSLGVHGPFHKALWETLCFRDNPLLPS